MTSPLPDDVTTRLRAALAESLDRLPVGTPPVFTEEDTAHEPPPVRVLARHRRRPVARVARVLAPLALAAAVAAVVVLPDGGQPEVTPTPDAAAPSSAASTPGVDLVPAAFLTPGGSTPMRPGQYRYQRTTYTFPIDGTVDTYETWQPQDPRQEWSQRFSRAAADGSSMIEPEVQTAACGVFPTDFLSAEQEAARAAHACDQLGTSQNPTPDFIAGLPTDPAALYERLRHDELEVGLPARGIPADGPAEEAFYVYQYAYELARGATGLSQPVSAALEQAVAMIPGVVVVHDATTPDGVRGTSYEVPFPGVDLGTMIFDADGNYVGGEDETIEVGAADAPLEVPAELD